MRNRSSPFALIAIALSYNHSSDARSDGVMSLDCELQAVQPDIHSERHDVTNHFSASQPRWLRQPRRPSAGKLPLVKKAQSLTMKHRSSPDALIALALSYNHELQSQLGFAMRRCDLM
jgi:hypothetical protein